MLRGRLSLCHETFLILNMNGKLIQCVATWRMNSWQCYQLIHVSFVMGSNSYGTDCSIMGPAGFNLISSSSGVGMEANWETSRKYRKRQSRTHFLGSLVLQKPSVVRVNVASCLYILLSNFRSQDYVTLSGFLKEEYVWLSLRCKFVALMHGGEGRSDFVVFFCWWDLTPSHQAYMIGNLWKRRMVIESV